jgi:predicted metalloprotease with PDZ domain
MNKLRFLIVSALWISFVSFSYSQENNAYRYSINLNDVNDHELAVTLLTPEIDKNEIIFRMPKMVPGTYHVYNFGRFVSDFTAYNKDGNKLPVEQIDTSSWKISGADKLQKITYKVRETWHPENNKNFVFEPAGTEFNAGKDYVLNNHAIFGYFDEMKNMEYDIDITKPLGFYGSTGMIPVYTNDTEDKFVTPDYFELVDMPILYTIPDTTVIKVGNTDVLISVYSVNNEITSKMLAPKMKALLEAQKNYLGGLLPVKKYAYLVYFSDQTYSGAAGALEHNHSSLYFLIEGDTEHTEEGFVSAAAHEFFHIITPLSIHSKQISNFDFTHPQMSEHLWMYEGVTEYTSGLAREWGGLITPFQFLEWLKNKILVSGFFNDTLPFTVMSKHVLDKYERQYVNVYMKGALIGMCLDLKLRSLSDGKYGIRDLMQDLSKRYGTDKAFNDDELFSVITELTYPEINEFFKNYVEGPKPLPLKEYFDLAGVEFIKSGKGKVFTLGSISLNIDASAKYVKIVDVSNMNSFGKKMGYKKGDEIVSINGNRLIPYDYREFIDNLFGKSKVGDELTMEVLRKDDDGKTETVKLKAPMMKVEGDVVNSLTFEDNPTQQQLKIREAWLSGK